MVQTHAGDLEITLVGPKDGFLRNVDSPWFTVKYRRRVEEQFLVEKGSSEPPRWNDNFWFQTWESDSLYDVVVTIHDNEKNFIGEASISTDDVFFDRWISEFSQEVTDRNGLVVGEIIVSLAFYPES